MSPANKRTVFVFRSYGMGESEDAELKIILARKFLQLVAQSDPLPTQLCFYTDGVRLCVTGSPVLEELRALEGRGVELVLCSTCLQRLGLTDHVACGVIGGMADIITAMISADETISL